MASFSKPIQASTSTEMDTTAKQEQNPNPKLIDENNVDKDAIKHQKLQNDINLSASAQQPKNLKAPKHNTSSSTTQTASPFNHRAFIESESLDKEDLEYCDVGRPKKPNSILEAADGSDDGEEELNLAAVDDSDNEEEPEEDVTEDKVTAKFETTKEELGQFSKTKQNI